MRTVYRIKVQINPKGKDRRDVATVTIPSYLVRTFLLHQGQGLVVYGRADRKGNFEIVFEGRVAEDWSWQNWRRPRNDS